MLKRGDSDYEWFKARTESLHSPLTSKYSEMAASTVLLTADTSQPPERAERDLPPKSYADAVVNAKTETNERASADDASNSGANDNHENNTVSTTMGDVNGFPPSNNEISKLTNQENVEGDNVHVKRSDKDKVERDKIVYEKHVNDKGDHLTSLKPDENYEKTLEHNRHVAPREKERAGAKQAAKKKDDKSQLASGRRAGAGWERSA
jgi:2-acylglycerol O-acyltransferase 2